MSKLPYLNLGCGSTYHNDWTNVDFVSTGQGVLAHNLLKGTPFNDKSFKVVYHSHVLEHFPKEKAKDFIKECYRVLEPGGIIRVAIPDLEQIAKNYLKYLDESLQGKPLAAEKYQWSLMEMYDQVVRTEPGGDMINYIKDASKKNDAFLLERNGHEVQLLIDNIRNAKPSAGPVKGGSGFSLGSLKHRIKEKLKRLLLKEDYNLLKSAIFRSQGEIHQWMYDRYSLKQLLEWAGFKNVRVVSATESQIPNWESFGLDSKEGRVRKPDSLFMEAQK